MVPARSVKEKAVKDIMNKSSNELVPPKPRKKKNEIDTPD